MTLVAGTSIGKYTVRRKLAEGGMAEIYLCSSRGPEGFEKEVVIKRIRSFLATDAAFVQMFIAEARLASRLNHPNLVQIFDFDRHDDTYYLAMEFVRGRSLWEVAQRSREAGIQMPPTLVAQVGVEVARGLHYAHRLADNGRPLGLVHRDVTPHNILLSYDGAVKLTDFGIAKAGNKLTAPGMLKGKFAYMAPEQARGEDTDARTDLFALGIVLWEMLTGAPLFDGNSDLAVLRAVQQAAFDPPARRNPLVAPDLDSAVMRALERDPAARFQSAQELERALARYVRGNAHEFEDTDLTGFLQRLYPDASGAPGTATSPPPAEPASSGPSTSIFQKDVHGVADTVMKKEATGGGTAIYQKPGGTPAPSLAPGNESSPAPSTGIDSPPGSGAGPGSPSGSVAATGSSPGSGGGTRPGLNKPAASRDEPVRLEGQGRGKWYALITVGALAVVGVGLLLRPPPQPKTEPPATRAAERLDAGAPVRPPPPPEPVRPSVDAGAVAEPSPPLDTKPKPAARKRGSLLVKVTPWAEVAVDGVRQEDVSGSKRYSLSVGAHRLRFTHTQRKQELIVNIEEGKEQTVVFNAFGQ